MEKTTSPSEHPVPQRVIDRFWQSVSVAGDDECWLWLKSLGSHGYGQVGWDVGGGRRSGTTAHRVAWLSAGRELPAGLTIDHICRTRPCCNPRHLRLRTNVANATDNGQGRKTHCPRGHLYEGTNLYVTRRGHRRCRTCARLRARPKAAA